LRAVLAGVLVLVQPQLVVAAQPGPLLRPAGPAPFSRLVYPIPEDGGLGVHVTVDMAGLARFGPDVEWLPAPGQAAAQQPGGGSSPGSSPGSGGGCNTATAPAVQHLGLGQPVDYSVDPKRGEAFYSAIRR
jgi:hypothetical protein